MSFSLVCHMLCRYKQRKIKGNLRCSSPVLQMQKKIYLKLSTRAAFQLVHSFVPHFLKQAHLALRQVEDQMNNSICLCYFIKDFLQCFVPTIKLGDSKKPVSMTLDNQSPKPVGSALCDKTLCILKPQLHTL